MNHRGTLNLGLHRFGICFFLLLCPLGWAPASDSPAQNPRAAPQSSVRIAAASDLQFAMEELTQAFARENPHFAFKISYGASGSLVTEIEQGAPFDLFFSADASSPEELVKKQFAKADQDFEYAQGRLVVWFPNRSPPRAVHPNEGVLLELLDPGVHKIAIANPAHAPYGRAAIDALKAQGVYERVKSRLVFGENVSQAAQYLTTGAADAGLIALGLALSPAMKLRGSYSEIPPSDYPRIEQRAVILEGAPHPADVERFKNFVIDTKGKRILGRFGYSGSGRRRGED